MFLLNPKLIPLTYCAVTCLVEWRMEMLFGACTWMFSMIPTPYQQPWFFFLFFLIILFIFANSTHSTTFWSYSHTRHPLLPTPTTPLLPNSAPPIFSLWFMRGPLCWVTIACESMSRRLFTGMWATRQWLDHWSEWHPSQATLNCRSPLGVSGTLWDRPPCGACGAALLGL